MLWIWLQVPYSKHFIFFITYKWAQWTIVLHYTMLDRLAKDKQFGLLGLFVSCKENEAPYFIEYNAHTSIVRTWISQWLLAKKIFLFFKNNFTRINHCKFIHHKNHLKPFLSYLPCIVHSKYFSIIFSVKKCAHHIGWDGLRPPDTWPLAFRPPDTWPHYYGVRKLVRLGQETA